MVSPTMVVTIIPMIIPITPRIVPSSVIGRIVSPRPRGRIIIPIIGINIPIDTIVVDSPVIYATGIDNVPIPRASQQCAAGTMETYQSCRVFIILIIGNSIAARYTLRIIGILRRRLLIFILLVGRDSIQRRGIATIIFILVHKIGR